MSLILSGSFDADTNLSFDTDTNLSLILSGSFDTDTNLSRILSGSFDTDANLSLILSGSFFALLLNTQSCVYIVFSIACYSNVAYIYLNILQSYINILNWPYTFSTILFGNDSVFIYSC